MSKLRQGILLGMVLCLAAVGVALWLTRDPIPPLSAEALAEARQRWSQHGPTDYEMTLQMSGDQKGLYSVTVRGGEVTELKRDDQPIPKRGEAWRYWTVPGLFALIDMELADEKQQQAQGEKRPTRFVRAAEFDETDGRPIRFRSIAYGNIQRQVEWRIVEFHASDDGSPAK